MVGDDFARFFVCAYNKWNPYSEEYRTLPLHFWIMSMAFIKMQTKDIWEGLLRPQGELVAQIANPDAFKVYHEYMKKLEIEKTEKKGVIKVGDTEVANANAHYDPSIGLVDDKGNVIIPKEQYQKMLGIDGIAISY